jgi:hypothetical protein
MTEKEARRLARWLKKASSLRWFSVAGDRWKWEYTEPCECGNPKCYPSNCFSAYSISAEEKALVEKYL